jgi:Tol biopolymer transport system component
MPNRRSFIAVNILLAAGLAASMWSKPKKPGVRKELAQLQEKSGITIASVDYSGPDFVHFATRSWVKVDLPARFANLQEGFFSPDGEYLAINLLAHDSWNSPSWLNIIQRDGRKVRDYPDAQNVSGVCWSSDKSKLAFNVPDRARPGKYPLKLMDLATGEIREIDSGGYVETQCFSPDGTQMVYTFRFDFDKHRRPIGRVKIYDLASATSRELTRGVYPTWSPDGRGIAYLDNRTYFLIQSNGAGRSRLWKDNQAYSALWWSPDSRFVAYGAYCCLWRSIRIMEDLGRLHVRRLSDHAEDWVAEASPINRKYGWIQLSPQKEQSKEQTHALVP